MWDGHDGEEKALPAARRAGWGRTSESREALAVAGLLRTVALRWQGAKLYRR